MFLSSFSVHLVEFGHFAAYLALAVAIVQALAPLAARYLHRPELGRVGVNASVVLFVLTSLGGLALIHAFVTDNFSVKYVVETSNSRLPLFYKVAALWGRRSG